MNIYQNIIDWSQNKHLFWKDAICRIFKKQQLENDDLDQLTDILKKEVGLIDTNVVASIPNSDNVPQRASNSNAVKLLGVHHPNNINALWAESELDFKPDGLTVIYGRNGSGKSGFAKILKKLCWSRDSDIELKKNVYSTDNQQEQSVTIKYKENNTESSFDWHEGDNPISALNNIYVFDSKCANIYLNNDTPTEYKPIGLDVLEQLTQVCNSIRSKLDGEQRLLSAVKPELDAKYNATDIARWYNNIEQVSLTDINQRLSITEEQQKRYEELTSTLNTSNPAESIKLLQQKASRYQSSIHKVKQIEDLFNAENVTTLHNLKQNYFTKKGAYLLALESFKGDDKFHIGSDVWKQMWNYAKQYAVQESSSIIIFPEKEESYCVLCHQPLNDTAKQRLKRFESYIQDTSSKEYESAKQSIEQKHSTYSQIATPVITGTSFDEITSDFPELKQLLQTFEQNIQNNKNNVCVFLQPENENPLKDIFNTTISNVLITKKQLIDNRLNNLNESISNRNKLVEEYLALEALITLCNKKNDVLKYVEEYKKKQKYNTAISKTDTTSISKKIGEIIESDSIALQQEEFIKHLQNLDRDIASKISISKARTSKGTTYKKCGFNNINDKVPDVLSEGEQKIVAFANFLSECTIDNATNTIVLDDPVTSLDQEYRESIAKMIIELSRNRQIIIFTHDLYFVSYLFYKHKELISTDCNIVSLETRDEISGFVTDDIPYLAKNVQQRIDTIRHDLDVIRGLSPTDSQQRNYILNDAKEKIRQLVERTVEDILIGSTVNRFKKDIAFKHDNLAHLIITNQDDITFLRNLYGKYSEVIHDGSPETVARTISVTDITTDISTYSNWKDDFMNRVKEYKRTNNIS